MKRKYNIYQLAVVGRRIIRRKAASLQQLVKNRKLTRTQHAYHVARVRGCDEANQVAEGRPRVQKYQWPSVSGCHAPASKP